MFQRTVNGLALRFHLAGINNQNFLMRDEQTGTYWQQINGLAISGPLAGRSLPLVTADELTFGLWKQEQPWGTVLQDAPGHAHDYAAEDWDKRMARAPTVISYAQSGLKPRDLMLGVHAFGSSRAFPYEAVLKAKLLQDQIEGKQIVLVVGPDDRSVRVFDSRVAGISSAPQFYRLETGGAAPLMDSATGSRWNFQGCATSGPEMGKCLRTLDVIKDYWFDWRNYNPQTTVFGVHARIY